MKAVGGMRVRECVVVWLWAVLGEKVVLKLRCLDLTGGGDLAGMDRDRRG